MHAFARAYAKSYTCPSTIDAQANADGSLDVTEARTFDFSGNFTAVWWTFDNMPTKGKHAFGEIDIAYQ